MKRLRMFLAMSVLVWPLAAPGAEAAKPENAASVVQTDASTNSADPAVATTPAESAPEPGPANGSGTNGLRLNFRGAPLDLVLDYLSEAAGFIINKEAEVKGTVDVWSKQPMTKEEAVELLNSVLRKNGYAVTRNGRILTIVNIDSAKTSDLDIISGSDPDAVDRSDEVVTQIIPVRHANATQLMANLQVLLPTTASLSANESANTLILVATKRDIRRMLKIVNALDSSIASVTTIKVFALQYADAKQLATAISQLFATQNTPQAGGRAQMFNMFRGGGFPGAPGAPAGAPGSGANAAAGRVVATADDFSNSLIVSAAADVMTTIEDMVKQIDQPISDVTELRVFHLVNADPAELSDQLLNLFPDDSRSGTGNNNNQRFRFAGGGRFGGMGGGGANNGDSDRMRKKTRVISVADPRTSSLIVSAAAELMPQIAEMVAQLDSSPAKKEKVAVFELQNADPSDVYQVLQDLFNRNNTMRSSANSRNSTLGTQNPLNQRATQQQNQNNTRSGSFGNSGRRTTGGGF